MMLRNLFVFLVLMLLSPVHGHAQAPDWKTLMTGIDGVIIYCDSTTRQSYSDRICSVLSSRIEEKFAGSGLKLVRNGLVHTGTATDDKVPSEVAAASLKKAETLENPLLMSIVIKGTDAKNAAIYARVQAAIPFQSAVESGHNLPGKAGDLVLAERAIAGGGPRKQLTGAVINALGNQVDELIDDILSGVDSP